MTEVAPPASSTKPLTRAGTVEISPTGDVTQDAANIQQALDSLEEGGTLLLKAGTYEFGSHEPLREAYRWDPASGIGSEKKFVSAKRSVKIKGERGPQGEFLTRVSGGVMPFCLGWDPTLGVQSYGEGVQYEFPTYPAYDFEAYGPLGWKWTESVGWTAIDASQNSARFKGHFVVEDLWFDRFTWAAIYGAACNGASIRNNRFTNGYKYNTGFDDEYGQPEGYCAAVYFTTDPYYAEPTVGKPGDLTGPIDIKKNLIECNNHWDLDRGYDPSHGMATWFFGTPFYTQGVNLGIYIWEFDADVHVERNQVLDGDWALIRTSCGTERASLEIRDNSVTATGTDPSAPSGRLVFWGGIQCSGAYSLDPSTGIFAPYGNQIRIEGNDVQHKCIVNWLNVLQLSAAGPGSTVCKNRIETDTHFNYPLAGSSAPIRLFRPKGVAVRDNVISGMELDGIWVQSYAEGDRLSLTDNDLSKLVTDRVQIGLLATDPGSNAVRDSVIERNKIGSVAPTGITDLLGNHQPLAAIAIAGEGNKLSKNDYEGSQIPGVADSLPCTLLAEESNGNLVQDTGGYPMGTNAKDQVLDLGTSNRVVGHSQDTLAKQERVNPGIGRRKKDALRAIASATADELDRRGRPFDKPKSLPKLPKG